MFLDGIVERENKFISKIMQLKQEGYSCYIFGAGYGASLITRCLKLHGIQYRGG